MRKVPAALVIVGLLVSTNAVVWANDWPSAFKCVFSQGYETAPEKNYFKSESLDVKDVLSFTIREINLDERTAQIVGNVGITNVVALTTSNSIDFIEKTEVSINLTSVYNLTTANKQYFSAHSRHVGSEQTFLISQRFGFCEAK